MRQSWVICARHAHQHPREPLQPYPIPTLLWQLVFQDLVELNGLAHLDTVDHYSDFYEIDKLPIIQSSAVIQVTKQHFGGHGISYTLITDNGAQFTSDPLLGSTNLTTLQLPHTGLSQMDELKLLSNQQNTSCSQPTMWT